MASAPSSLLLGIGLMACVGLGPVAIAAGAPPRGGEPVLVVASPWSGATAEAYDAAGAWIVLSAAALEVICDSEDWE